MQTRWFVILPFLFLAPPAFGDIAFTPNQPSAFLADRAINLGMIFTPLTEITVTALGFFNYAAHPETEQVAIYNQLGHLIAQTSVTATATDGYTFAAIPSLNLSSGAIYVVDAFATTGYGYSYAAPPIVSPAFLFKGTTYTYGASLTFPASNFALPVQAYYGPDFVFSDDAVTPEPSFWVLTAAAVAGMAAIASRKRA